MITFEEHIKLYSSRDNDKEIIGYLATLSPEERVKVSRSLMQDYPLDMSWNPQYEIHKNFNVCVDVMDLVLGQFIMIEQIITGKTNFANEAENDLALAKLLLRPKHQKHFDNEDEEQEVLNEKMILSTPVKEVYSVLDKFLKIRDFVLFTQFKGVFYEITDDDDDEEEYEKEELIGEALFQSQWYWYSMVRMLAQEDVTKYNDIYMLKMSTVMPEMSYLAQKSKVDAARERKQQMSSKL
jgi:hypothetical protein